MLRGSGKGEGIDIKAMFANLPAFFGQMAKAKAAGTTYLVDDGYLQSLRGLVQETGDPRKQWLGYLLIATTLDVHSTCVLTPGELAKESFDQALAKHLNSYLAQINITLGKGEVLANDLVAAALKAWMTLTVLMHREYD